jgi:hypothetical protein
MAAIDFTLTNFRIEDRDDPLWKGRRFRFTLGWHLYFKHADKRNEVWAEEVPGCVFGFRGTKEASWEPPTWSRLKFSRDYYEAVLGALKNTPYEKYIGK